MNAKLISRIVGGIALVAVVSVSAMVVWSVQNQRTEPLPMAAVAPAGLTMGDLTGYVGHIDRTARTVEVAEDTQGLHPIKMAVTDETTITVRGKQGGLGDLQKDQPVRAFYEVRNDVKYVTSLQVVVDKAQAKTADEATSTPAVAAAPPAPRQSASFKTSSPPSAPAPPSVAATPAPVPARTAAPTGPPLVPPIAPAPPLTPVAGAPTAPRQTVSADGGVDARDGSEAVDWLLKLGR